VLDLRRLLTLNEVARLGSFSAAADALNFTQSAISQQIAALESQTGVRLLTRNPVALTEAGEALCRRAAAAAAELDVGEIELARLKRLREGRLRLGAFASAGAALMPRAIATFRRRHPNVSLTLAQHEVEESDDQLKRDGLDLAITFGYSLAPLPPDPLLTREPLLDERVFVALSSTHPLAGERKVALSALIEEPWIQAVNAGLPLQLLAEAAGAPGFEPEVSFEGDDFMTVLGLVEAGIGVAVVPELALDRPVDVAIRPLDGEPLVRSTHVTTLNSEYPLPAVTAMVSILKEIVASLEVPGERLTGTH
jgi:DNA-binding transcriptional LysR family regulator